MKFEEVTNKGFLREFTLHITADELNSRVEDEIENWVETKNFPGFRKGKIPAKIIMSRNGEQIKNEVIEKIVESALKQHSEEHDYSQIAFKPDFDTIPSDDGEHKFSLSYEVLPEVPEIEFDKNIVIQKPVIENLEDIINKIQQIHVANLFEYLTTDQNYVSCENDLVHFRLLFEGMDENESEGENFTFIPRSEHEFASHFIGVSQNDVLRFHCQVTEQKTISFNKIPHKPENEIQKENDAAKLNTEKQNIDTDNIRDAIDVIIIISEIKKNNPVEFNLEYAQNQGYKDCEELMATEKKKLEDKFNQISDFITSLRLVNYIDNKLDFDLPEKYFEMIIDSSFRHTFSDPKYFKYRCMFAEEEFILKNEFLDLFDVFQSTNGSKTIHNNDQLIEMQNYLESEYFSSLGDDDNDNELNKDDIKVSIRRNIAFNQYCVRKKIEKEFNLQDVESWVVKKYQYPTTNSYISNLVSDNEGFRNFVIKSLKNEYTLNFIRNLVSIESENVSHKEFVDLLKNV